MKSKAGNKLKKVRGFTLAMVALALTACLMEPEQKDPPTHQIDPSCFHLDSTTWADSGDVDHLSCHFDPSNNPVPPGPQ